MRSKMPHSKTATKPKTSSLKVIAYLMLLLVLLFTVYRIVVTVNAFTTIRIEDPLKNSVNTHFYTINGARRTLFMYVNGKGEIDKCFAVLYSDENADSVIYNIPSWVYVQEYSDRFDDIIPVKNLLYAGGLINQKRQYEYALWQIQNISALTFDSYIVINETANTQAKAIYGADITKLSKVEDYVAYIKSFQTVATFMSPEKFKIFASNISTNLDLYHLYDAFGAFASVLGENTSFVEATDTFGVTQQTIPNGDVVKFLNYNEIDKQLQNNVAALRGKVLQKEQVRVEVFNGSSVPKAAIRYSRFVSNSGCLVVRYGNSSDVYEKSKIYVSDPKKYAESLKVVKEIFVHAPEVIIGRPDFLSTGDIVVVLGEDIQTEVSWE